MAVREDRESEGEASKVKEGQRLPERCGRAEVIYAKVGIGASQNSVLPSCCTVERTTTEDCRGAYASALWNQGIYPKKPGRSPRETKVKQGHGLMGCTGGGEMVRRENDVKRGKGVWYQVEGKGWGQA